MRKLLFLPLLLCLFSQAQQNIQLTDLLKIKTPSQLSFSPAGKQLLFSLQSIEAEDAAKWEYKYSSQLWLASTNQSLPPRALTSSRESASQGAWSPDGKQIAFVRPVDGKPQIFLLSLEGGEAVQLTKSKFGASNPKWKKDGSELLFVSTIPLRDLMQDPLLNPGLQPPTWSTEKPGIPGNAQLLPLKVQPNPDGTLEEIRAWMEQNEKDKKAKVITKLNFQEESGTTGEMSFSHVYALKLNQPDQPKPITKGFFSFSNPQYIPESNKILIEADYNTETHPDRTLESQLYTIDLTTGEAQLLLGQANTSYNNASVAPNGKWVAFLYGATGFASTPDLGMLSLETPGSSIISLKKQLGASSLVWSEDAASLYCTQSKGGGILLSRITLPKGKSYFTEEKILTPADAGVGSYAVQSNQIAFVKTAVANPFEIHLIETVSGSSKALTSFNSSWLANRKLSYPEKYSFKNEKGQSIDYWVMKPIGYEAGKKYPLLLEIHGGPTAMWGPGENSMWHEFQFWCSKGYGVVYANPRGSGGYGSDFLRSNINDWGNGPMKDVLTALDKTVAEGWADTSKLTVTGGSYAGYLIGYIVGHDKRFKAACSQRGVYDLRTFFGEGNAWRLVPNYFGGYPWEKNVLQVLERESPINYVQNITTPYLIFHGENDLRTGVIQSEQMYKSLKVLGRPVEYVRHPGATHEITRSGNNRQRMDQMIRTWEFFERMIR